MHLLRPSLQLCRACARASPPPSHGRPDFLKPTVFPYVGSRMTAAGALRAGASSDGQLYKSLKGVSGSVTMTRYALRLWGSAESVSALVHLARACPFGGSRCVLVGRP